MITTKQLAEIRRLNALSLPDRDIAETIGLKYHTVRYHRIKEGLPAHPILNRHISPYKHYCVYDAKTSEFIIEGTATECADRLDILVNTFRSYATNSKK